MGWDGGLDWADGAIDRGFEQEGIEEMEDGLGRRAGLGRWRD